MTDAVAAACQRTLDEAHAAGGILAPAAVATLAAAPAATLEGALRAFADAHGEDALPVLVALSEAGHAGVRRAARRALYRLAQRGIAPPRRAAPRPVVERREERPLRAWVSAIDGTGSRAMWILFEGAFGGLELCSLIVNDTAGILEVAGGGITKKRFETELANLRAAQKLPWIETAPARACALVAAALAVHRAQGTAPPAAFARWRRHFEVDVPSPPAPPDHPDPALVARGAELLEAPEMGGWFLEPADVQADALELLQAQASTLVVSDQAKGEREAALITRVVERELGEAARRRWALRLLEAAVVFEATARAELAAVARAAAGALAHEGDRIATQPFARALARRALEVAGEVATGRLSAATASRIPATTEADRRQGPAATTGSG
jgi:hypothetical protein